MRIILCAFGFICSFGFGLFMVKEFFSSPDPIALVAAFVEFAIACMFLLGVSITRNTKGDRSE